MSGGEGAAGGGMGGDSLKVVPSKPNDVYLADIVMPRSRSKASESMTRSPERAAPVEESSLSRSVVFPWSTCAMTAMLRMSEAEGECSAEKKRSPGTNCALHAMAIVGPGGANPPRRGANRPVNLLINLEFGFDWPERA